MSMALPSTLAFRAISLLLAVFALSCATALADQLSPLDRYFLVAFDMELSPRKSAWLVPYFDTKHLEEEIDKNEWRSQVLTESVLDDYVLDEKAFDALPAQLKKQLSKDLNLENRPLTLQRDSKLLDSHGKPIQSGGDQSLALPKEREIALPENHRPSEPQPIVKSELALPAGTRDLPAQSDWAIVNARWKFLSLEKKQAAVSISHLSDQKIAKVISSLPIEGKDTAALAQVLRLRPDAPEWMRGLNMSLDFQKGTPARPLEFAPKKPNPDVHQGFQVIQHITDETRTTAALSQPHKQIELDHSFHLHLGLTYEAPQWAVRELDDVLLQYKRLLAIRMLAAGTHNDELLLPQRLGGGFVNQTAYEADFRDGFLALSKGLVRKIDSRHIEIRVQTASPLETYREFSNLLASRTEAATTQVRNELKKLFAADPSIVKRILKYNPKILTDFSDVLGADRLREELRPIVSKHGNAEDLRESIPTLGTLLESDPSIENFKFLMELRNAAPPELRYQYEQPFLFHQFEKNEATTQFIAGFFKSHPSERPMMSSRLIMGWGKESKDIRIDLLRNSKNADERLHILSALRNDYGYVSKDDSPEIIAERARLSKVLTEVYRDPATSSGTDWLLADDLLKQIEGSSSLHNPHLTTLMRDNLWKRDASSIAVRYFAEQGLLPQELTQGYKGAHQVTQFLSLGYSFGLIEEYARSNPEDRKLIVSSLQHLRDLGAAPPQEFFGQLRNSRTSHLPSLRKAAQEFESALDGDRGVVTCILRELGEK
jgi:hypothetical protein